MSDHNARERAASANATAPAKLPALPAVRVSDPGLQRWIEAAQQWFNTRAGATDPFERALTVRDLVQFGLVDSAVAYRGTQQRSITPPSTLQGADVLVRTPNGAFPMSVDAFAKAIADTALFRDLMTRLDDPRRFDRLPEEIKAILTKSIADEAAARGAEVRRLDSRIQDEGRSMAFALQEVTASVEGSMAGVRELSFASATQARAVAGQITQVQARIDGVPVDPAAVLATVHANLAALESAIPEGLQGKYYQVDNPSATAHDLYRWDGAGYVPAGSGNTATVEQSLLAVADRSEGLEARYTLKVQAGNKLAGFGIAATENDGATTSAFVIAADKFAIVDPSETVTDPDNPDPARVPFGVDTVNNIVYINGNVRINAGGPTLASLGTGTSYYTETSVAAISLDAAATTFTPTTMTVYGKQQTGSTVIAYSGRFKIDTSPDGSTWTNRYTSPGDESSYPWPVTPTSARFVRVQLYQAGGTTTLLDEQAIPVIQAGATGADGKPAITVVMRNMAHAMPANSAGTVTSYANSRVRIQAWEGGTPLTFNTSTGIGGVSKFYVSAATVDSGTITAGAYSTGAGTTTYESADHSGMTTDLAQIRWVVTVRRSDGSYDSGEQYPTVQTVTKAKAGVDGSDGADGADGGDGERGSLTGYGAPYGLYHTGTWAEGIPSTTSAYRANRVISNLINNEALTTNLTTYTHLRVGDTVTLTDGASATSAITRVWAGGSGWINPGVVIDGNLVVTGTIAGDKIAANAITAAKIAAGAITAASIASSSTFNGASNTLAFSIGGSAAIATYSAGASFELNDGTKYALIAANTSSVSGGGGFAAGAKNGSSYAGTFANSDTGFSGNHRSLAYLCNNNEAGYFLKHTSSVNQTTLSEIKLAENSNAIRVLKGNVRIDQAPTASGSGGAATLGNLPTGSAAANFVFVKFNFNGADYWVPAVPV